MTGRGFGKTMTGAQTVRKKVETDSRVKHVGLASATAADTRDVMLGLDPDSSGLLQVCPPWNRPVYQPSYRRAVWPNGVVATLYSAEEPERVRGPQHNFFWGDEPASWPKGIDMLSNIQFGLRREPAQLLMTGTPKPGNPLVKELMKQATVITRGTMYENTALSASAVEALRSQYEGTRLGRQELGGELLDDNPDALWTYDMIDKDRMSPVEYARKVESGAIQIGRGAVAVDPAVTANKNSNATGILYGHLDRQNPPHAYIIEDATMVGRPDQWSRAVIKTYKTYGADRVIGEVNNGGDLIENTIRQVDKNVSYKTVRATKGKMLRAEPVSALYEKHRVHHVGIFPKLEEQQTEYDGSQESPDNLDALVWLLTHLIIDARRGSFVTW
jgi:phage terminase large subunit-like protein